MVVALVVATAHGQVKTKAPPPAVKQGLNVYVQRIGKGLSSETIEFKPEQWKRTKWITAARSVRLVFPEESDFAEKPYKATLAWDAVQQETLVYGTRKEAEKSAAWQTPGRITGLNPSIQTASDPDHWSATLYYTKGQWQVEAVRGQMVNAKRAVIPLRFTKDSSPQSPWWLLLSTGKDK